MYFAGSTAILLYSMVSACPSKNNQFAARYGQGASKFASRLSEDKIGSMAPAATSELSRAMSSGLNATRDSSNDLTAKERSEMRSDYLAGLATAQDKSARAMDQEKIAVKMNEGAKNSWRSFETMPQATARTKDQQEIADKYNLDDIISNYNQKLADYRKAARSYRLTGDEAALRQAGYDVIRAAAPASELILSSATNSQVRQDLADMSSGDRGNLDYLSRLTGNDVPKPITQW